MFTHGVCSGDPVGDGFVLWTRAVQPDGQSTILDWDVASDVEFRDVMASGSVLADATADHTCRVDVRDLEPSSVYFYRFRSRDETSPVGRARTLPDGSPDHLRFAMTSCALFRGGFYNVYARLAERDDLAFVIHLGDYIYEFPNALGNYAPWNIVTERHMEPDGPCFTLDDYRARYACTRRDPDLMALHQAHTFIHQWDDHEVVNDAFVDGAPEEDTAPVSFAERKHAGLRAFWEWMPVRWPRTGVGPAMETIEEAQHPIVYRSFPVGDLVDLVCIDTRHEGRRPVPATAMTYEQYLDPDRVMMSDEQKRWLRHQLSSSSAKWRMIANQAMFGQLSIEDLPEKISRSLRKLAYPLSDGRSGNPGQWEGFAADRADLLRWLRANEIDDLIVLTGDIHSAWALDLEIDGEPSVGVEFVSPSVSTRCLGDQVEDRPGDARELESLIREQHPWVKHVDLDGHGYVVIDVTPERVEATWWMIDDVRSRHDRQVLAKSLRVRHGTNHLEPAD